MGEDKSRMGEDISRIGEGASLNWMEEEGEEQDKKEMSASWEMKSAVEKVSQEAVGASRPWCLETGGLVHFLNFLSTTKATRARCS